jgi:hypothetical protein
MLGLRIGMGAAALAVLGAGIYLSGKIERDSRDRIEDYTSAAEPEETPEPENTPEDTRAFAQRAFDDGIRADAEWFGLEKEPPVAQVHGAQTYSNELEAPVLVAPGRNWTSEHISVEARLDKIKYQKLGATVSARHVVAVVKNISEVPIAYRVRLASETQGHCEVHGARQHNAMALMPGETAEIVVCAGGGKIRVQGVEVLEVSELGHRYLSRVPPRAVGVDSLSAHAHLPPSGTKACETVDVGGLNRSLRDGSVRWVDIVDFYSRHSCDRFRYSPAYRYQPGPRAELPIAEKKPQ